jgi:hypothetical protein
MTDRIKLSLNQFNLLKCFYATGFGPLRRSLGVCKQQNVSTFVTTPHGDIDPLLIVLSYKIFYIRLWCLNIQKYLMFIIKTSIKLLLFLVFAKKFSCYV